MRLRPAITFVFAMVLLAGCDHDDSAKAPGRQGSDTNAHTSAKPPQRSVMRPTVAPPAPVVQPPQEPARTESISFAGHERRLTSAQVEAIDQFVHPFLLNTDRFIIRGHTDDQGSDRRNKIIAERRARLVAAHLRHLGVSLARLQVIAIGEGRPISPNVREDGTDDPAGRARNRRVEIDVEAQGADEAGSKAPGA